jgi:hypothetical protein
MLTRKQLAVCLALALFTIPVSAAPIAYVLSGGSQQFGAMDLATGAFSPIGPIPATIQYLVPGPNGSLLTMSFNGDLDSIDPATGTTSAIGATGFTDCSTPETPSCGPHSQLSLGSAGGMVYATDFANNLYTVNPVTGKATLVGATGIPAVPFIPATITDHTIHFYDENLFDVGGKLYANFDAGTFNFDTAVSTTVIAPVLYQIDTNTGHASKVASTAMGLVTVVNLNGTVYGFSGVTNQVVTLDVTNGTTSFVSDIDQSLGLIGGASPVPEPASIALAGIGIAGIVFWKRRQFRF